MSFPNPLAFLVDFTALADGDLEGQAGWGSGFGFDSVTVVTGFGVHADTGLPTVFRSSHPFSIVPGAAWRVELDVLADGVANESAFIQFDFSDIGGGGNWDLSLLVKNDDATHGLAAHQTTGTGQFIMPRGTIFTISFESLGGINAPVTIKVNGVQLASAAIDLSGKTTANAVLVSAYRDNEPGNDLFLTDLRIYA